MGLDAVVYCDCFEKGRIKEFPPFDAEIYVEANGSLYWKDHNLDYTLDDWVANRMCEHEDGILLHHYIGNITRVGIIREELTLRAELFPIILNKVIYNGTHCGDFLTIEEVKKMEKELKELSYIKASTQRAQTCIDYFDEQMKELFDMALCVNKPIAF